jgi:leader peptidase (prepilin peptidase)/N-methyltransferase
MGGNKDIRKREIPPYICILAAALSVLDFKLINLFGILAALPLYIIARWIAPKRLGGGDIKLTAAVGLILGLQMTNCGLIIGFTLQVLIFISYALLKRMNKQEALNLSLPLAPCLAVGFFVTYLMKLGGICI